jgi:hypothetical protein
MTARTNEYGSSGKRFDQLEIFEVTSQYIMDFVGRAFIKIGVWFLPQEKESDDTVNSLNSMLSFRTHRLQIIPGT